MSVYDFHTTVADLIRDRENLRVLDAGCGSIERIKLTNPAYVVGIDISEEQLARSSHLRRKILADIQSYDLPESYFDVIVCWNLLEHLQTPGVVVERFIRAVKPGGLIILAAPNVYSLKGLITKFTPHRFHVWFYRFVLGSTQAGQPGRPPFPTFLRHAGSVSAIVRMARKSGIEIVHRSAAIGQTRFLKKSLVLNWGYKLATLVMRGLVLGLYDPGETDFRIILRKPILVEAHAATSVPRDAPVYQEPVRA